MELMSRNLDLGHLLSGSKTKFSQLIKVATTVATVSLLAACLPGNDDKDSEPTFQAAVSSLAPFEQTSPVSITGDVNVKFYQNIPYGKDERNYLDIYLPTSDTTTPLVIYIHGGGFTHGDKDTSELGTDINAFLDDNIAFASINYSLLADGTADPVGLSRSLSDTKEALQFLRNNSQQFNFDTNNVAVYGESAGAGASLWLALSDDMKDESSDDPLAQQSTRVVAAGAIETQGSYDLVTWETTIMPEALNFQLDLAIQLDFEWYLAGFYGITDLKGDDLLAEIRNTENDLAEYRATVDFLSLADMEDAPIFLSNTLVPADISDIMEGDVNDAKLNALLHYPTHATAVYQAAALAGLSAIVYAPQVGQDTANGLTVVEFLKDHLNVD